MGILNRSNPAAEERAALRHELVESMTPEERVVTHAAAVATGEARIRLTDRRLLILFLLVVGVGWWLLHNQQTNFDAFKRAQNTLNQNQQAANDRAKINCQHTQIGFLLYNTYLDGQEKITLSRQDLTPSVKAQLIANDERSKLQPLDCS